MFQQLLTSGVEFTKALSESPAGILHKPELNSQPSVLIDS